MLGGVAEAGQGGIKATLGHAGMPTKPLTQLNPGATQLQSTHQQVADGGIQRGQLGPQPGQLRTFRGVFVVVSPRLRLGRRDQGIEEGAAVRTHALPRDHGFIQAAGTPQGPQGQGLIEHIEGTVEGLAELGRQQWGFSLLPALFLQGQGSLPQLPETPRHPHQGLPVSHFMLNRPFDVGDGEAAQAAGTPGVKGIDRLEQAQAAHLGEIVEGQGTVDAIAGRNAADQGQIGPHQGLAQDAALVTIAAGGKSLQP